MKISEVYKGDDGKIYITNVKELTKDLIGTIIECEDNNK